MTDLHKPKPSFKIVSLIDGNPATGINYTLPAFQAVRLGQPIQHWEFRKAGDETYRLNIGGYGDTGVIRDNVVSATIEHGLEWKIIYREYQDAYSIVLANDHSLGWTVPPPLSGKHDIVLERIISTQSIPPHFIPSQLFKLVADD